MYKNQDKNIMLQSKVDQIEQDQRETNVRVIGFPEQDNTDADIRTKLVQLVGASDKSAENIISTSRMGRVKDDRPRDLIIKFTSKKTRDEFYSLRKRTPKDNEIRKVYINEDLTESRAKLFYDARQLVKRSKLYGTLTHPLNTEMWDDDTICDDASFDFQSKM